MNVKSSQQRKIEAIKAMYEDIRRTATFVEQEVHGISVKDMSVQDFMALISKLEADAEDEMYNI